MMLSQVEWELGMSGRCHQHSYAASGLRGGLWLRVLASGANFKTPTP